VLDVDVLSCLIEDQRIGLLASDVIRIVRAATLARLPEAPDAVLGILNLHGALVPVFELRARFRFARRPVRSADHMVVARAGDRTAAAVVERVEALLSLPASSLQEARLMAGRAPQVAGVVALPDGSLILYDLAAFLTAAEGDQLDRALAGAAEGSVVAGSADAGDAAP
jgi:purine-binding chemotaxis protein CheW